jgi:hypothetical protein
VEDDSELGLRRNRRLSHSPRHATQLAERASSTITVVVGSHVSMVSHPATAIDAIIAAVADTDT